MPFYPRDEFRLHYLERPGPGQPWLVLHGLTANSGVFEQLELPQAAVLPDLRGRGQSDQPEDGYCLEDHALDVLPLCGPGTTVVGHSFGGLLGLYLAAHYPERVGRLVVLDSGVGVVGPNTMATIGPSLDRLRRVYAGFEEYVETSRAAGWPAEAEAFFRADVRALEDGRVACRTRPETILEVVAAVQSENWPALAAEVRQPVLLLRAQEGIVGPEQLAQTRQCIPHLEVLEVPGNHFTMLYGQGARAISAALR